MVRTSTFVTASALLLSTVLGGCLGTHHPTFGERDHLAIRWRTDLPSAAQEAEEREQPILLVGVSGKVDGLC